MQRFLDFFERFALRLGNHFPDKPQCDQAKDHKQTKSVDNPDRMNQGQKRQ